MIIYSLRIGIILLGCRLISNDNITIGLAYIFFGWIDNLYAIYHLACYNYEVSLCQYTYIYYLSIAL